MLERPALVFVDETMAARIARLSGLGLPASRDLPRVLNRIEGALLEAPEGTALLLLTASI
jgi:hypothetical protein